MEWEEGGAEAWKVRRFVRAGGPRPRGFPGAARRAGQGCALPGAPARSATSWALLRRPTRHRPPGPPPAPPANRGACGRAPGPERGGGEGRRLPPGPGSARGEPAAAPPAPGPPPRAGGAGAPAGAAAGGELRLRARAAASVQPGLGRSFLPCPEPHASPFLGSAETAPCELLRGLARCQGPGETFAAGERAPPPAPPTGPAAEPAPRRAAAG